MRKMNEIEKLFGTKMGFSPLQDALEKRAAARKQNGEITHGYPGEDVRANVFPGNFRDNEGAN